MNLHFTEISVKKRYRNELNKTGGEANTEGKKWQQSNIKYFLELFSEMEIIFDQTTKSPTTSQD